MTLINNETFLPNYLQCSENLRIFAVKYILTSIMNLFGCCKNDLMPLHEAADYFLENLYEIFMLIMYNPQRQLRMVR